ncbi:pyridoxamine 5'-phosphate oxidase family protein [Caldanaerobius polysaccharolyticus]|uniref:pyridoxamine 5'-phosphate oxidase family protein n=1 Tax=Caldanaerobius polysaccharolyticus TaxID=44256 RepID=UPI00047AC8DF|nr:pyridoxamine 5'-phosphate oxidase family protein [Caldanaerobius polysaccharolyticus]
MEEIVKFLTQNPNGAFATVDDGKPRVRPWQFQFEQGGKFYFCTSNTKNVYKELQKNPYAEFTSTSSDMISVRLSGKVVFTDDLNLKQAVLDKNPSIKAIYKSADNPSFEVFYIEHGEGFLFDITGKVLEKVNF